MGCGANRRVVPSDRLGSDDTRSTKRSTSLLVAEKSMQTHHCISVDVQTDPIEMTDFTTDTCSAVEITKAKLNHSSTMTVFEMSSKDVNSFYSTHDEEPNLEFSRLKYQANQTNLEWVCTDLTALNYSMIIQREIMAVSSNFIKEASIAMKSAEELRHLPNAFWNLLEKAEITDDVRFFIRAYTLECDFYKILNRKLATLSLDDFDEADISQQYMLTLQNSMEQFNLAIQNAQHVQAGRPVPSTKLSKNNWPLLYLRTLSRFNSIPNPNIRFEGKAYRGVWLSAEDIEIYSQPGRLICNKSITSTSKLESVALDFLQNELSTTSDSVPTLFIYSIKSLSTLTALSIKDFSDIPLEEEVLLLPGTIFTPEIRTSNNDNILRIEMHDYADQMLHQLPSMMGMLLNGLRSDSQGLD